MRRRRAVASLAAGLAVGVTIAWTAVASPRLGQEPISDSPPEVIADSLIGLWIDSLGGSTTYDRFQTATYTVTTVLYDRRRGLLCRVRGWKNRTVPGELSIRNCF